MAIAQLLRTLLKDKRAIEKERPSTIKYNRTKEVAVDQEYFYLPMYTCPIGVKVLLLNPGKVATLGVYNGKDKWLGWAPLPKIKPRSNEYSSGAKT